MTEDATTTTCYVVVVVVAAAALARFFPRRSMATVPHAFIRTEEEESLRRHAVNKSALPIAAVGGVSLVGTA